MRYLICTILRNADGLKFFRMMSVTVMIMTVSLIHLYAVNIEVMEGLSSLLRARKLCKFK